MKCRRKRARGDPIAACNYAVCGGGRAGLGAWQQDRRWWTQLELGKFSFHTWKEFFTLSEHRHREVLGFPSPSLRILRVHVEQALEHLLQFVLLLKEGLD